MQALVTRSRQNAAAALILAFGDHVKCLAHRIDDRCAHDANVGENVGGVHVVRVHEGLARQV